MRAALQEAADVNIVAIGSSSTKGEGAKDEASSYPGRLCAAFAARFARPIIHVLNRGVDGEEAGNEEARFDKDVFPHNPPLVIWQVGTNGAWKEKDYVLADVRDAILRGLDRLAATQTDVVLMNLQYAPALLDEDRPKPRTQEMQDIIAQIASDRRIGLFRRFEIMRYWHVNDGVRFDQMISNFDGFWLHQNDWSYNCVAQALCEGIISGVTSE
ncbi:SGNH/GDSL hydrolase family protein [Bradyrhizobium sp. B097]|uniref:SGNH/GDSL hydrolase family protein n=1 Tax=Bradyrhizobium sp. B097 TaxID=3140244 RepID=UPI003183069E